MADDSVEIRDASLRTLRLRKINVLDQVKLLRAIATGSSGAVQSNNQPYVALVNMAASVSHIDGVPMPPIGNERQIDAAIARIGDEGFAALQIHTMKEINKLMAEAELAADLGDGAEAGNAADPLLRSGR